MTRLRTTYREWVFSLRQRMPAEYERIKRVLAMNEQEMTAWLRGDERIDAHAYECLRYELREIGVSHLKHTQRTLVTELLEADDVHTQRIRKQGRFAGGGGNGEGVADGASTHSKGQGAGQPAQQGLFGGGGVLQQRASEHAPSKAAADGKAGVPVCAEGAGVGEGAQPMVCAGGSDH